MDAAKIASGLNLPEGSLLERRNAAIACLALPDLRLTRQWAGWPAGSDHIAFDGKLEHYARTDTQGAVSIRLVAGDEEIAHLPGSGSETYLGFSGDGKFLAVWSSIGDLKLWKLGGGDDPVLVASAPTGDYFAGEFSSDSRWYAIGHVDGSMSLYDLTSEQPPRRLPSGRPGVCLAFHPGGRQLAVACNSSVEIRDLDTGKVVVEFRLLAMPTHLAWRPDGKTLAVACQDFRIYLWNVEAGEQTLVLEGLRGLGIRVAFNHAGNLLASTGWEGLLRLWDPRTGKQLFSTPSGTQARFSLDDHLLAADVREGKIGLWEVVASSEYRTLVRAAAGAKGIYQNVAIRSDGRLLAVTMLDGVGFWELPSGKELAFIKLTGANYVFFERSGELLTNGAAGLLRWPVQADPAAPGLLRIGPPHVVRVPGTVCQVACPSTESRG